MISGAPCVRDSGIFVHGISERAGTNFLRWLLACHAAVEASPRKIWEFPHQTHAHHLLRYAQAMQASPKLPEVSSSDLLEAMGSGLLTWAHGDLPEGVRVLIKEPSVIGIESFFEFFPHSHLILLVRDGRDIAASLRRTKFGSLPTRRWRRWALALGIGAPRIADYAERWRSASETIASMCGRGGPWSSQCTIVKYEDLMADTVGQVRLLLERLDLAPDRFDWDRARELPIKGSSFDGATEDGKLNWSGVERSSVNFQPVGRWHDWSSTERLEYVRIAGSELQRWGYALEQ